MLPLSAKAEEETERAREALIKLVLEEECVEKYMEVSIERKRRRERETFFFAKNNNKIIKSKNCVYV